MHGTGGQNRRAAHPGDRSLPDPCIEGVDGDVLQNPRVLLTSHGGQAQLDVHRLVFEAAQQVAIVAQGDLTHPGIGVLGDDGHQFGQVAQASAGIAPHRRVVMAAGGS